MLIDANTDAVIKKTLATLAPVYKKNIGARDKPIKAENAHSISLALSGAIECIFAEKKNTNAKGAKVNSHPSPESPNPFPPCVKKRLINDVDIAPNAVAPVMHNAMHM